jgi:hypothetical protein
MLLTIAKGGVIIALSRVLRPRAFLTQQALAIDSRVKGLR